MYRDFRENKMIVIPTNEHNIPLVQFKNYFNNFPTLKEIEKWNNLNAFGYGLLCNDLSEIRCIDLDDKHDKTKTLSTDYLEDLKLLQPEIYSKLYIEKTKNNGSHLIFKAKLSCSIQIPIIRNDKGESLIDIFFNNHLVVIAPTKNYFTIQGKLFDLNYLNDNEVNILLEFSEKYNQYFIQEKKEQSKKQKQKTKKSNYYPDDINPAILYNTTNNFKELLFKNGWHLFQRKHDGYYFTRPGKNIGTSAVFYFDSMLFHVFTTSSDLEQRTYEPWHLFIIYVAHNNAKLAHDMLVELGYGGKKRQKINFHKTGYLEFLQYFFKENSDSINGIRYSNKEIYKFYLDFNIEHKFPVKYEQIAITKLIKGAAKYFYYDFKESRSRKEKFTTFIKIKRNENEQKEKQN